MTMSPHPSRLQGGLSIGALAFAMLFGYALVRPASESMFLQAHGGRALPTAWLVVTALIVVTVAAYNRAAARHSLTRVLLGAVAGSAVTLAALLLLRRTEVPGVAFALYAFKDVHVVVLLEALWSFASLIFQVRTARWTYGLFCASGSVGGMLGNLTAGWLAAGHGSEAALWLAVVVFAAQLPLVAAVGRAAGRIEPTTRTRPSLLGSLRLLGDSPYLVRLLALVGTVQVVITLVDYQFNVLAEAAYPDTDARTKFIGEIYATIDGASLALQLATGPLLRLAGVRGTMLAIPVVLGATLATSLALPTALWMAATKVASKALDYSVFRAAKEILYIPLSYDDKTRGKALIDMLGYRLAKGGTGAVLTLLAGWGLVAVGGLALALVLGWLALAWRLTANHPAAKD